MGAPKERLAAVRQVREDLRRLLIEFVSKQAPA
jgi:hypothetical protein